MSRSNLSERSGNRPPVRIGRQRRAWGAPLTPAVASGTASGLGAVAPELRAGEQDHRRIPVPVCNAKARSNHLACVLLNAAMGINITHIPYRAGATIFGTQDLIAGRIDYMSIAAAISQIEGNHRIALRQRVAANRPGAEDK